MEKVSMFLAHDVIKDIIEGKNKGKSKELSILMKRMDDDKKTNSKNQMEFVTNTTNLFRAIWLANPDSNINQLQKLLSYTKIIPVGFADFKNEKEVIEETIRIVKTLSKPSK